MLVDDDTVLSADNLVAVLGKYDWREMVYVGAPSESHSANTYFSHSMAFGGGGVALSFPLAAALARTLDVCIERYPRLYGGDDRLHACITELGVPLSREYGFHQITVLEEMAKLKERIEKQDRIIEDLRNKQSSHVNREPEEVNCEATYEDNFQLRPVHSKRKRIECDVPVQDSLSEQQEFTKNKAQEQVTQNKIPRLASSKKARPAAMTVGTIVVLKSTKYPNKEPVAYATLLSYDLDAEVMVLSLVINFGNCVLLFQLMKMRCW